MTLFMPDINKKSLYLDVTLTLKTNRKIIMDFKSSIGNKESEIKILKHLTFLNDTKYNLGIKDHLDALQGSFFMRVLFINFNNFLSS